MQRLTKRNIKVINHDTGQQIDFPTFGKEAGEDAYNQVSNQLTSLQAQLESSIASMSEAIVTDKTLTIEDAPADAKATGDAINNLRGAVGSPLVAATAAAMIDTNKVYVYTGSETGYTNGNWYYYDAGIGQWRSGGVYNSTAVTTDKTLSVENSAADAKATGDAIDSLNKDITQLGYMTFMTFTSEQKSAILDAFRHVAWSGTDGQEYIDAMEAAFDTTTSIKSLTAVSDGTTIPVNAPMAEVKETLTVTAVTSDDVSITVPDSAYNLTGALTIGSCTLTVSYGGLTATVTVTVGMPSLPDGYTGYSYIKHSNNAPATGGIQLGIYTDIVLKSDYTIDADIKYDSDSASIICICGTRSSTNIKEFALFVTPRTGKLGYWYGGIDSINEFTPLVQNVNNHITAQPVGVSETYPEYATLRVDETDYSTGSTATGQDWSPWFGIWAYAISASELRDAGIRNVGLQIGNIVVKDGDGDYVYYLTPASDGTYYGFYDLINDNFYYNETYASNFEGVE